MLLFTDTLKRVTGVNIDVLREFVLRVIRSVLQVLITDLREFVLRLFANSRTGVVTNCLTGDCWCLTGVMTTPVEFKHP